MNRSFNVLLPVFASYLLTLGLAAIYGESFLLFEFGESRMVIDSRQSHDDLMSE